MWAIPPGKTVGKVHVLDFQIVFEILLDFRQITNLRAGYCCKAHWTAYTRLSQRIDTCFITSTTKFTIFWIFLFVLLSNQYTSLQASLQHQILTNASAALVLVLWTIWQGHTTKVAGFFCKALEFLEPTFTLVLLTLNAIVQVKLKKQLSKVENAKEETCMWAMLRCYREGPWHITMQRRMWV